MSMFINRSFFLLWAGQLVSQLGDKFYAIALAWWVLENTNSPTAMGLFLVASVLPELLFGLVAGRFIDRWNRKAIIVAADIFRGCAVLVVTLLFWTGGLEIWHIYLAAVVISLSSAFFNPTVMAVIPQLVERDVLPTANSLSQMITGVATVTGPVLGATFVSLIGFGPVFLVNGLSYMASALLESFIVLSVAERAHGSKTNLLRDIKDGFKFISNSRPVFIILLVIGVVHVFYGSLVVAMPFVANSLSGNGIRNLGYLETAMGLGMILGAVLIGRRKIENMHGITLFKVILAAGLCFSLLGIAQLYEIEVSWPYIAILLFIGMAAAVASIYWRSLLQVHVPNELAGRVFSVSTIIADVSLPVSFGVFGIVFNHFHLGATLLGCGLSLIISSAALILNYRRVS